RLGVEILQGNLGFRHSFEVRVDDDDAKNRILVRSSVQLEPGSAEVLSIDENLSAALWIFCRRVAPSHELLRSRRQQLKVGKVTVQNREVFDIPLVKLKRHVRAICLELWSFADHFSRLAHIADRQRRITV